MVIDFRYGFTFKDVCYGWYKKELYRIPYTSGHNRSYPLKKMTPTFSGNKTIYQIGNVRKSTDQLIELTTKIDYSYNKITNENIPF